MSNPRRKKKIPILLALAGVLLCLLPPRSLSAAAYSGCYNCAYVRVGLTGSGYKCKAAGDNQTGEGTTCIQEDIGGPTCATSGNPCYNTVVSGGGGTTGTGTGGGGTCAYDNGSCAPWCAACNQVN